MITMGFNTLAMLTWGLGIRMPWPSPQAMGKPPSIEFKNKPLGVAIEEKTGPMSFEAATFGFGDINIGFKDR